MKGAFPVFVRRARVCPSRHFAAMQRFSRYWSEADIEPFPFTFASFPVSRDRTPPLTPVLLAAPAARAQPQSFRGRDW